MRLQFVVSVLAVLMLPACGAVGDYLEPTPRTTPTCYDGAGSAGYSEMQESMGVPDCPRSTRRSPRTDSEIEKQAEQGQREMDEFERQYREESRVQDGSCVDVTSIDNNWDNDVLCTREDGSQFYTDYDGATRFEADY